MAPQKKDKPNKDGLKTSITMFFKRVFGFVSASFIDFRRSPLTIFFAIAYPVILILLFGAIFSEHTQTLNSFTIYIQAEPDAGFEIAPGMEINLTETLLTTLATMETNDSEPLFILHYIPLLDEHTIPIDPGKYLEEVDGYFCLVIPANFTMLVYNNATSANLTVIMDENSQSAKIVYNIIKEVIYGFNLFLAGESETHIDMETIDIYLEEKIEYLDFLVPGIIGVALMNNAVMGTINRYTSFRKAWLFKKLASTPMTRTELVTSESAWQGFLAIISTAAIMIFGWLFFKVPFGKAAWIIEVLDWKMIPILIAGVLGFTGLGMIGSRFVKNPDAATAAANFLAFPMMFLCGAFFDVSGIAGVNVISKLLPLTYIIDALRATMITKNVSLAWYNIGISFAFGIGFFIIGVILTNIKNE